MVVNDKGPAGGATTVGWKIGTLKGLCLCLWWSDGPGAPSALKQAETCREHVQSVVWAVQERTQSWQEGEPTVSLADCPEEHPKWSPVF